LQRTIFRYEYINFATYVGQGSRPSTLREDSVSGFFAYPHSSHGNAPP